jgi:hypothetical protein
MATVFKNQLQSNIGPILTATVIAPSTPAVGSVRLTFATQTAIPFPTGSYIVVSGISVAGYNGTFLVTGGTTSTVTFANATTTGAATGGVIQTALWVSNASAKTTVIGLSLTNTSPNILLSSVQLQDSVAGTTAYYAKDIPIPPNQSLRLVSAGEKLILGPSTNVLVSASSQASMDAILSFVEIS